MIRSQFRVTRNENGRIELATADNPATDETVAAVRATPGGKIAMSVTPPAALILFLGRTFFVDFTEVT